MKRDVSLVLLTVFLLSCLGSKQTVEKPITPMMNAGRPTIVYKTTGDFYDQVPVTMNAEKTQIVSYPAPTDIHADAKPTRLKNGYLLDNRGIGVNSVFLDYTCEAYSQLPHPPTLSEMQSHILEKNPLTELVNCGVRYQYNDMVPELNALIDTGFQGCQILLKK
ncbi:MAG: hypothetical protein LBN93_01645 [Candidatus Symbiothrix sp.]|jgi:hypothetical protein|nr:hypothetical protein [Candidatus Symbiothrix sp.]